MPPKKPILLVTLGVVLLIGGIEAGLQFFRGSLGSVLLINEGTEPIEDLRVTMEGEEAVVPRIEAGESAKVSFGGHGPKPLKVKYRQKGSALTGFELPSFDPDSLRKENFRLVIRIRPDEFERYQDDDDPSLLMRFTSGAKQWLSESVQTP